jgi:CRISPR system Cascade subunit CasE
MYISRLRLDLVQRGTRELLINPYMLHKAVFRAFPDIEEGGPGRVLYRLDEEQGNGPDTPCLLVQSEKEPYWQKAELLTICSSSIENKPFAPIFASGQVFVFRLRANPTVKKYMNNKPMRLGILQESEQLDWLKRKGTAAGFMILDCRIVQEGMVKDEKHNVDEKMNLSLLSVKFEGKLKIIDPGLFQKSLENGIGSAKGFGFGLLSLAPVRGE